MSAGSASCLPVKEDLAFGVTSGKDPGMRIHPSFLLVLASAFLVATPAVEAEDRNSVLSFVGKSDGQKKKSSSSSKKAKEKRSNGGFLVGGPKRVEINLATQKLRAYEGNRLVMQTRISSGRTGNTPTGSFRAGPYKAQNHYSSLYHNAHMPWSVQVTGHIFIHGFAVVPRYPASKGCIRVPISGSNPARRLYKWLDVGTPIRIHR